jgi:hypothetical protein
MLFIVGTCWVLALLVFALTQWLAPAFLGNQPASPTSGFNYSQSFGLPFIKTFGLWVAGALLLLGPLTAIWRAIEHGADAVADRALGTSRRRR